MKRWFSYPLMTLSLVVMWLLLNQSVTPGQVLLGIAVALTALWATSFLEPEEPRIRFSTAMLRLVMVVLMDIIRSNIAVGRIILSQRSASYTSGFINIPLDVRSRYSLAVLAIILTATPGTLWMEHDARRNVLLLHVLDLVDEQHWIDLIKTRYERLLMDIFE